MAKRKSARKSVKTAKPAQVSVTYLAIFAVVVGVLGIVYVLNFFPGLNDAVLGATTVSSSVNP